MVKWDKCANIFGANSAFPSGKVFRKVFAVTALQNTSRLITFVFFPYQCELIGNSYFLCCISSEEIQWIEENNLTKLLLLILLLTGIAFK